LKLYGMRASYDEVMASAIKRQKESPRVVGDLLKAAIAALTRLWARQGTWPPRYAL
jgi:hypothetical protein